MPEFVRWIPTVLVLAFWCYAVFALISGRMMSGGNLNSRIIDRRASPIRFWIGWVMFVGILSMFTYMLLLFYK